MALTDKGYSRPTYEEVLEERIQRAKELFGEDIDTDEKTPLGKFIRIGAYDLSKAYEDIEAAYYARFPNTASGTSLDHLCVFSAITRNPATYAERVILVSGEAGTEVEEINVCGENRDITFHNIQPFIIPESGTIAIIVMSDTVGTASNNEDIKYIVNPIVGVDSVQLVKDTTEFEGLENTNGEDVETDYELRKRLQLTSASGSCNANAIRAAIMRVPTVIDAGVVENDTDTTDEAGRPAGTYECYAYGGKDYADEIAQAIFDKKALGTRTVTTAKGDNAKIISVKDDGGYFHNISFSYATEIPVHIQIQLATDSTFTETGEKEIETALTQYIDNLGLGKEVVFTALYGKIYGVTGVTDVVSLKIKANKESCEEYGNTNIPISQWEYAKTSTIEFI